ncbi:MAG: hypothetical protein ACKOUD_05020 [Rhodoluna sp.]
MLRINPNQPALWRDLNSLQIGAGGNRVILNSLNPAQERLIAALYRGIADRRLPSLLKDLGVPAASGNEIVTALEPLLMINRMPAKESLSEEFVAGAFSEIVRASLLNSSDGAAVLMERKYRTVHVDDLAGAGLAITLGLASAGVGQVVSHDQSRVEPQDLGPSAYPSQLLGKSKISAVRALLAGSPNQMHITPGHELNERKLESIDCAVVVAHQAIEPRRYVQWLNRDVPHLAITFETDGSSVSPLVVPGRGPCLYCLEQARIDQDESWPVLVSQLVNQSQKLDDSASRLFCAGLAIQKLLDHLDDLGGFQQSNKELVGYKLSRSTGLVEEVVWSPHPTCTCQLASS